MVQLNVEHDSQVVEGCFIQLIGKGIFWWDSSPMCGRTSVFSLHSSCFPTQPSPSNEQVNLRGKWRKDAVRMPYTFFAMVQRPATLYRTERGWSLYLLDLYLYKYIYICVYIYIYIKIDTQDVHIDTTMQSLKIIARCCSYPQSLTIRAFWLHIIFSMMILHAAAGQMINDFILTPKLTLMQVNKKL